MLIGLAYVSIRLNIIGIPLDRDEGVFGYTAQVILNHGLPYKDVFDHKPPLVFYIYAMALYFIPPTSSGVHIFLHCYNFVTLICLFFLAKVCLNSYSAGLWTAFVYAVFSASPVIQGFTASTEMFMLLPMTLSILLAVLSARDDNIVYASLSGISGALAFWTKQTALLSALLSIIYLAVEYSAGSRKTMSYANTVRPVLAWFAGVIGISLFIGLYFHYKGVFGEFIYWSFTHNVLYSRMVDTSVQADFFSRNLENIFKEDFLIIGIGFVYGISAAVRKDKRGYFSLGFLLLSFAGTLPGQGYPHYFAQLAPATALAAGAGINSVIISAQSAKIRYGMAILSAALIVFVPLLANPQYYFETSPDKISRNIFGYNPFPESVEVAKYLKQHTAPGDRIFIIGSEPQILLYSGRKSSSAFVIIYPLMASYPRYQEFQERMYQEISNNLPAYIVTSNVPYSFLWDGKADLSRLIKLEQLFYDNYRLEKKWTLNGETAIFLYQKM